MSSRAFPHCNSTLHEYYIYYFVYFPVSRGQKKRTFDIASERFNQSDVRLWSSEFLLNTCTCLAFWLYYYNPLITTGLLFFLIYWAFKKKCFKLSYQPLSVYRHLFLNYIIIFLLQIIVALAHFTKNLK